MIYHYLNFTYFLAIFYRTPCVTNGNATFHTLRSEQTIVFSIASIYNNQIDMD